MDAPEHIRLDLLALLPKKPAILILDFDGVMTDDRVYVDENGKEMVACTRGDGLGVTVLRRAEFLREPGTYRFHGLDGADAAIEVPAGSLAFSVCQVPVLYELCPGEAWIRVTGREGTASARAGCALDATESRSLLLRDGGVRLVHVGVPEGALCGL